VFYGSSTGVLYDSSTGELRSTNVVFVRPMDGTIHVLKGAKVVREKLVKESKT